MSTPRSAFSGFAVSSYGREAGSARVRLYEWLDRVEEEFEVLSYLGSSNNAPSTLLRRPTDVLRAETSLRKLRARVANATVILSRQASPVSRGGIEAKLLAGAQLGVYDFDDALYLEADDRAGLAGLFPKADIWRRAVQSADVVVAGNATLAAAADRYSANVVVIPSCVDPADYSAKANYEFGASIRAIWIGTPSTEEYLQRVERPLLAAHHAFGLRLMVVSGGNAPRLGDLERMIDRVPWRLESFARHLATADMGLMPLPDTAWARGKCAYKLLQYAASGLPMIGDPVGANAEVLRLGSGVAPESERDWFEAIASVIDESSAARAARGRAARAMVIERFSYDAWEDAWRSAVGLPPRRDRNLSDVE